MTYILDLNGGTVTVGPNEILYVYQITDTSVGHDGELIIEAGSKIVFDNLAGAGFLPAASAITITINGTAAAPCEINVPIASPQQYWLPPALTITMTASWCTFRYYQAPFTPPGSWTQTSCNWYSVVPSSISSGIDLNGDTLTLSSGVVLYVYQITDTSVGHDGVLIMEQGSSIVFDDAAGSGFAPEATNITVIINGTSTYRCGIHTAPLNPANRWELPPLTASFSASYTDFRYYALPLVLDPAWTFYQCTWDYIIPVASSGAFSVLFPHLVSIENRIGYSARGAPVYSSPVIYSCYYMQQVQNILTPDGNEAVSTSNLLVDGSVVVAQYDRVTLPDGTVRPVLSTKTATLPSGTCMLKVVYL